jgi:hypothetical protein
MDKDDTINVYTAVVYPSSNNYIIERLSLRTRVVYINQIIAGIKKVEYRKVIQSISLNPF